MRKLILVASDPYRFFERLQGRPEWKLRVGTYRVIGRIDPPTTTIWVTQVGHRRNVYDA